MRAFGGYKNSLCCDVLDGIVSTRYFDKPKHLMQKRIIQDLDKMLEDRIIDEEIAGRIRQFYLDQEGDHRNRQYVVFGILGALLIGLGIILIIAHNWDQFGRMTKTLIGFAPLVLAQILVLYTLAQQRESQTWRESTATLLVFGMGATLSLISQIYHIPGSMASFMLTWSLLILTVVYLLPSTMTAVLYLSGITWYGAETGYGSGGGNSLYYWLLILPLLPYYFHQLRNRQDSNFTYLLNWMLPLSVLINLGTIALENPEWLFVTYLMLFGLYYLTGKYTPAFNDSLQNNGYRTLGSVGMVVMLVILSFHWIWKELAEETLVFQSVEFFITLLLCLLLIALIIRLVKPGENLADTDPSPFIPVLFFALFIAGRSAPVIAVVLINLTLFLLALYTIRRAMQMQHLGLLNYGLVMITALIICRFFDTNISFILRGLLFVMIGTGFFIANHRLIKSNQ
jgi:uncharacterized membrane protein